MVTIINNNMVTDKKDCEKYNNPFYMLHFYPFISCIIYSPS